MPRLLLRGEWYDPVSPESIYEKDFERLLLAQAEALYPSYRLVPFKRTVQSRAGTGIPDLALIDKEYRSWWVVEVELGHHPLRQHVEPQVEIFTTAAYGESEAAFLAAKNHELDYAALREMMRGAPPRVLVLVNRAVPSWASSLSQWGALTGVVEMFRSARNNVILRINGEHPQDLGGFLSICRADPYMPRSLIVDSPAALRVGAGEVLRIEIEDGVSEWTRLDSKDRVWLIPLDRCPLPSGRKTFVLSRRGDGSLFLDVTGD
jgi:hypothetical protein